MTTSIEQQLDAVPDEIVAALPETIRDGLRQELNDLTECLGERWLGGPWLPEDDTYPGRFHTQAELDTLVIARGERLADRLDGWSDDLKRKRVLLPLFLWQECRGLWDAYLVYRTLRVVETAVGKVPHAASGESAYRDSAEDWETAAWQAACAAMRLITADADIFRQVVLSDPSELAVQARRGVDTTAEVIREIGLVLCRLERDDLTARGLRYVEQVALENQLFYGFIAAAAKALSDFHGWLATSPRLGSSQLLKQDTGGEELSVALRRNLLQSIDEALEHFRSDREGLRVSSDVLSCAEPWEQLLREIQKIVLRRDGAGSADCVFVPRRVSIRYCYPFAVQTDENPPGTDKRTWLDHLRERDLTGLKEQLTKLRIEVRDVRALDTTAFFSSRGSEKGLYGGLRVGLPDVELAAEHGAGQAARCKVWIVLSRMGNHCLCIEREPLETPLPQIVYRAMAAGTPSVFGVTTTLADGTDGVTAWDNLHSFSRDVIRVVSGASFWCSKPNQYMRGNLHEVIIAQADDPLATEPDGIAAKLNSAPGGRTFLKSVQRTATTIDEWVRYPPMVQTRADGVSEIPELGLAGDWCAHTGETTVFGITAAPSWHSDVYKEAAQFSSSWSPLLRLWNKRLQDAIDTLGSYVRGPHDTLDPIDKKAMQLRQVEQLVRRHLAQIRSEELCATLAHRRFLDRLLEMSGIARLQGELESQLAAAERLTDWWTEFAERKADQRRDKLLGVIALFGMFELGGFLELANATQWHESFLGLFTVREGVWEDWLVVALFATALVIGFSFDIFGLKSWLGRILRPRHSSRPA